MRHICYSNKKKSEGKGAYISNCYYSEIGSRAENEDTIKIKIYGDNMVAVVADGLGGQGDGKEASEVVCDSLIQCGENGIFPESEDVRKAFEKANSCLLKRQRNMFHMKSTAVYLCIHGNRVIWGHIGDTRLYHLYKDKIVDFTLDHSSSQLAVFLGEISREQIPQDSGRNRLLRALGIEGDEPDVHEPLWLKEGVHAFLLCTDGLWEHLTDRDIENVFAASSEPKSFVQAVRSIKDGVGADDYDNNSAVVVYVQV